ncbi:MAG: hypothetical protein HYY84_17180 [Deltaproteobacteria bacterium]|nr:hypothetical protein [Deltaproteobacteria bacterium]
MMVPGGADGVRMTVIVVVVRASRVRMSVRVFVVRPGMWGRGWRNDHGRRRRRNDHRAGRGSNDDGGVTAVRAGDTCMRMVMAIMADRVRVRVVMVVVCTSRVRVVVRVLVVTLRNRPLRYRNKATRQIRNRSQRHEARDPMNSPVNRLQHQPRLLAFGLQTTFSSFARAQVNSAMIFP